MGPVPRVAGGLSQNGTVTDSNAVNDAITATAADVDSRFRVLVQSPLRAGLLRFLAARPADAFDVEALMAAFGRMRLDVQNCVLELVEFGVARKIGGDPARSVTS